MIAIGCPDNSREPVVGRPLRATPITMTKRAEPATSLGKYRISHSNDVSKDFLAYLKRTKTYQFRLIGTSKNKEIVKILPYVHRWTPIYQKSILAKFYTLDKWLLDNPCMATMFHLTVYQGSKSRYNDGSYSRMVKGHDLTAEESLDLLKTCRKKLLNVFRNRYPGLNYVWVLEAHKTGFSHCHLIVFREFTEAEQNTIKELWSCKYEAGSLDHGVKVSSSGESEKILSMKNYLMKYMDKQFGIGTESWTKGDLLFNATIWKTKTRMWGASKELTAVMKKPEVVSDVIWDTVDLLVPDREINIWSREDGQPVPVVDDPDVTDPDDLCPEGYLTKQIWKNRFKSIEFRKCDMQIPLPNIDPREARRLRNRATGW